ncbi:uncharacterized protein A4U43_C07F30760 [Asparagus officinalis]|uniref:Cytochrome b6-f complex subunit 7 n=1 Tax=Asparagus officinalis TaxID=4686 RepID=A0A5P1EGH3_ASPOF|nr:uncharacterized protein LOC109848198 [Asparagus officinalis]ONK64863.1 uncharacterized protein A4U43_C07F30760 [Asparagus officinalis]
MATISTAALSATALSSSMRGKPAGVVYVNGLNSFGGLKAHNSVASLGVSKCTEQSFATVVNNLKGKRGSKGGALSSTCNAAAEIFQIAAVMNGLVLVGVAVGFVLLRIEATLEEAE